MNVAVFSTKQYDRDLLSRALGSSPDIELDFIKVRLTAETAVLSEGHDAVCCFVHDELNAEVVDILASKGIRWIALRCAGFNNLDLDACKRHDIRVCRVPAYSPYAVAEHAVGLILELNRKFSRAHNRIRENDFSLDGLEGFDIHGKSVGVIGTGKIGACFARIMLGFGCRLLAYDVHEDSELKALGVEYVELDKLFAGSDIISLHCPLLPQTKHLVREETLSQMKPGVMIINTSRGPLIDTTAAIQAIKSGHIGYLGLDVYEEEEGVFFEDRSSDIIDDDELMRLTTFPNVRITSHQAFFTREALANIAETTADNLNAWASGADNPNEVG